MKEDAVTNKVALMSNVYFIVRLMTLTSENPRLGTASLTNNSDGATHEELQTYFLCLFQSKSFMRKTMFQCLDYRVDDSMQACRASGNEVSL